MRVGGRGRPPFAAQHAARASPFYEWKAAILNEPRTRSGWPLFSRARATLGVRGAEAGSGLRALAVPNFAARAAAADVLVYQASGEIPPRSRIRELGFRSARVAPPGYHPHLSCNCTVLSVVEICDPNFQYNLWINMQIRLKAKSRFVKALWIRTTIFLFIQKQTSLAFYFRLTMFWNSWARNVSIHYYILVSAWSTDAPPTTTTASVIASGNFRKVAATIRRVVHAASLCQGHAITQRHTATDVTLQPITINTEYTNPTTKNNWVRTPCHSTLFFTVCRY